MMKRFALLRPAAATGLALLLAACAPDPGGTPERAVVLGPADGHDLPPTDLERVAVGDPAPDFTLLSLEGSPVTLSSFRGHKNVVLVFYRGWW